MAKLEAAYAPGQVGPEILAQAAKLGLGWNQIMQIMTILLSAAGQPLTMALVTSIIAQIQAVLTPAVAATPQSTAKPK
jgi:hypothetical protein